MFGLRSKSVKPYKDMSPGFDARDYFSGEVKGWGLVQNWRGQVQTRFDMKMIGSWEGDIGKLEEYFTYYSGRKDRREWRLEVNDEGQLIGRADDVVGEASGQQTGCVLFWNYNLRLPVGDKVHLVKMDDRMWRMNDGVLINRAYVKKFGITVAELTVFMQKV